MSDLSAYIKKQLEQVSKMEKLENSSLIIRNLETFMKRAKVNIRLRAR